MSVSIFQEIKERISLKEIAEAYGIEIKRNSMACCPFHDDSTPSMKIYDKGYICYGCGEKGDTIQFVSKLYSISQIDAAKKINQDFSLGISLDSMSPPSKDEIKKYEEIKKHKEFVKMSVNTAWNTLSEYYRYLREFNRDFAPQAEVDTLHILFVESLHNIEKVSYISTSIADCSTQEERFGIVTDYADVIAEYAKRLNIIKNYEKKASIKTMTDFVATCSEAPDKIFFDETSIKWMYFNPDSSAGGQIVVNNVEAADVSNIFAEARQSGTITDIKFFDRLSETAKQYLHDITDDDFVGYAEEFINETADITFNYSNINGDKFNLLENMTENMTFEEMKSAISATIKVAEDKPYAKIDIIAPNGKVGETLIYFNENDFQKAKGEFENDGTPFRSEIKSDDRSQSISKLVASAQERSKTTVSAAEMSDKSKKL